MSLLESLDEGLRTRVFTHSSYLNETTEAGESNERLEFLGDAVLDLVVAEYLFERFDSVGEGDLTRMRASLVRGDTIAAIAASMGLGERLRFGRGEEAAGGRTRERNLAGVFEAVVAAVFLSGGLEQAKAFILGIYGDQLAQVRSQATAFDAKSALQQAAQARWHEPPVYRTADQTVTNGDIRFTVEVVANGEVLGTGTGRRKREAQQRAAAEALAAMKLMKEDED